MDEFNFIFLALGFLMTIWSWMAVKKRRLSGTIPCGIGACSSSAWQ